MISIEQFSSSAIIVYIISFASLDPDIYLFHQVLLAFLLINKAFILAFSECTHFMDIFFPKFIAVFLNYIRINNYLINLVDS